MLMVEGEEGDSAAIFLSLAGAASNTVFVATKKKKKNFNYTSFVKN